MDAGAYEVMKASEVGANIITVLGSTDESTIEGAVEEAKKHGMKILVDVIYVKDLAKRAYEVDGLGVDYNCVHTGYDLQVAGESPFEHV